VPPSLPPSLPLSLSLSLSPSVHPKKEYIQPFLKIVVAILRKNWDMSYILLVPYYHCKKRANYYR
jgi:hypothetical protein